jgi:hypothetical protein
MQRLGNGSTEYISSGGDQTAFAALCLCHGSPWKCQERTSVKGEIKEGAGFIKEEMNEHGKSPESKAKAQEGRDLRNEGRAEDGKAPKTTKPGTGHPEK